MNLTYNCERTIDNFIYAMTNHCGTKYDMRCKND